MDFPKLRYVESFPVSSQGEKYVCLRDPLNFTDKIVFLPPAVFFAVSLFDGDHSVRDIQVAFMRQFGQLLYTEKIKEIIDQLDANLFLESERFQEHKSKLVSAFLNSPARSPVHAGTSYPAQAEELRKTLDNLFIEIRRQNGSQARAQVPLALVAPHIDLRVGGNCYASAYEQIRESDYELFVVLGTAHAQTRRLFAATSKDYETPLGVVRTEQALLQKMKDRYGDSLFEDEFVHKQEHSIEFQTIFLKYLLPDREFAVLPVLCGSFHRILYERKSPHALDEFQRFVDVLKDALAN